MSAIAEEHRSVGNRFVIDVKTIGIVESSDEEKKKEPYRQTMRNRKNHCVRERTTSSLYWWSCSCKKVLLTCWNFFFCTNTWYSWCVWTFWNCWGHQYATRLSYSTWLTLRSLEHHVTWTHYIYQTKCSLSHLPKCDCCVPRGRPRRDGITTSCSAGHSW